MTKRNLFSIIFFITVFFVIGTVSADVPHLINYQAYLTDSAENPLSGSYDIVFTIYDQAAGGAALWTETHPGVMVQEGHLHVLLGGMTPVTGGIFEGSERWMGIRVGSDPEMTPRLRIASVPFAFAADSAQKLQSGSDAVSYPSQDTPITESFAGESITSYIDISGGPVSLENVTVDLNLNPTGEISYITLESPDGTNVQIWSSSYGESVQLNVDKDRFPADGDMSDFAGEDADGTWTLTVMTGTGGTVTTLNAWTLLFNESACECEIGQFRKLNAGAIQGRDFHLKDSSDKLAVDIDPESQSMIIGGNGGGGSLSVRNYQNYTGFNASSSQVSIGGYGQSSSLTFFASTGGSTIYMRGYNGSIDMNGELWVKDKIELNEISEPSGAPVNRAYLFLRDNGAGKTQLCVKFASGAVQVLAVQP